jgi:hypothetical protein
MGYRNKKSLKKGKKINKRTANKFKNTGYENIIKGGVNTPPKAIAPDNLVDPRAHQKCKNCKRWINQGQDKSAVCSQYVCQYCPICINPQPPEQVFVSPNPTLSLSPEPEQPIVSPSPSEQSIVSPSSSEQPVVSPSPSEQSIVSPSSSESQYGDSVYSSASSDENEIENIDDFLDQVILKLQEILDL